MAARNFNRLAGLPLIGTILKTFLEALFDATSGHNHDGTPGNGGPLVAYGGVDDSTIEENGDSKLQVKAGGIAATHLAADAVETAKVKNSAISAAKLASDAVETAKVKDKNITEGKLADAVVAKIDAGNGAVRKLIATATQAEINAGKVILADAAGVTLTPVRVLAKVAGPFADGTSIVLSDNNGTPVAIATLAVAALTDGAVLMENSANVTLGAGFLAALTAGKGLKVAKAGNDFTGGTSVTFVVEYTAATA